MRTGRSDYRTIPLKKDVWLILDPQGWVVGECPDAEAALAELERLRAAAKTRRPRR